LEDLEENMNTLFTAKRIPTNKLEKDTLVVAKQVEFVQSEKARA
jgi:hypothetical protein